jgi:hypothetical protein
MPHELIVRLTEQEYAALAEEAAKKGKKPETLLYETLREWLHTDRAKQPITEQEFEEKLYLEGLIENIPTREPLTPKEQAEREYLGRLFSGGKLMSEMVKEDRGPY